MTPKLYTGLRKANAKEKQSSGRDEVKSGPSKLKWPLNGNFMAIWDKICCTLATLGGCTLNRGSFACKVVQGGHATGHLREGHA